jgi:amino-acid N-acetyltransferase
MTPSGVPEVSQPPSGSGFSLRPAREDEQPLVKSLIRNEHLNPLSLNWRHFWLAETEAGDIVGCGQVKTHGDDSRELASLVVLPDWRSRGVAGSLISRLKQEAGAPLWLTCRSGLIPFYARFGFEDVTHSEALPPYFRRLRGLAKVFLSLVRPRESMAVMVWSGGAGEDTPPG